MQVVVEGLPSTSVGTSLKLRGQSTELIVQPGPPEVVPPGQYTLRAEPTIALDAANNELLYACTPDREELTVLPSTNLIVRIQCEVSSRAGLFVHVEGETGGAPAAVERVEGEGVVVYPTTTFDANVPPGPVVLTARAVTGGGIVYRPTPDRIELVLSAGRVTRVAIIYAP
ncbi:MAG TPA: hypothetical protein VFU46_10045 [Gemmatimonadales bacterium]|nr:hypothetical protein [Gemmatimonadales bacterium]